MIDTYLGISQEEFTALAGRYKAFQDAFNDPNSPPVKVFSPISKDGVAGLALIREVSKDLAIKKEDDMQKAAQKAAEMKEKQEEKTEQKTEDSAEEKKPETEK